MIAFKCTLRHRLSEKPNKKEDLPCFYQLTRGLSLKMGLLNVQRISMLFIESKSWLCQFLGRSSKVVPSSTKGSRDKRPILVDVLSRLLLKALSMWQKCSKQFRVRIKLATKSKNLKRGTESMMHMFRHWSDGTTSKN